MVKTVRQIVLILRLFVTPTLLSALLILSSADTSHAINLGLVDGNYNVTLDVTNDLSIPNIVGRMTVTGGNISDWGFVVDANIFPGRNIRQGVGVCILFGQIQDQCALESVPNNTYPKFFIASDAGMLNWFYVPVAGPGGGLGIPKYVGMWQATLLPPELVSDLLRLKDAVDNFLEGLPQIPLTRQAMELSTMALYLPPLLVPIGPVIIDLRLVYAGLQALLAGYETVRLTALVLDPPDLEFGSVFQPRSYSVPGFPPLLQPLTDLYSLFEALQVTAYRLNGALLASDFARAELQRDALRAYLAKVIELLPLASSALAELRNAIIVANILDEDLLLSDILSFQQELAVSGFPTSDLQFFEALGLSNNEINQIRQAFLAQTFLPTELLPSFLNILPQAADSLAQLYKNLVMATPTIGVNIDIKPGSAANAINPNSKGIIPVAILSTSTFDATTIDPVSVRFGPSRVTESHGKGHVEDINSDGRPDLLLHFRTALTGIQCGDTAAFVVGSTFDGQPIAGLDFIRTVHSCRGKKGDRDEDEDDDGGKGKDKGRGKGKEKHY